jgi:hypothetical protein
MHSKIRCKSLEERGVIFNPLKGYVHISELALFANFTVYDHPECIPHEYGILWMPLELICICTKKLPQAMKIILASFC